MTRVLLHGFLGDPSVWDGIIDGHAIALPGHRGAPVAPGHRGAPVAPGHRGAPVAPGHQGAPVAPGHRGAPVAPGPPRLVQPVAPTWAENLAAIAAQIAVLEPRCEMAIGYSLGARVALGLLAMGAVERAILISVNPGIDEPVRHADNGNRGPSPVSVERVQPADNGNRGPSPVSEREARRASDRAWAMRFRSEPLAEVLDAWEAQPLFATQSRVAPDVLAARRARRLQLEPEQLARSLEAMGLAEMPDYRAVLARAITEGRCTLVVGADDAKYLAIARAMSAAVQVIEQCGHDPLLEQPAALAKVLASLS